jgi:hypothetical protein
MTLIRRSTPLVGPASFRYAMERLLTSDSPGRCGWAAASGPTTEEVKPTHVKVQVS